MKMNKLSEKILLFLLNNRALMLDILFFIVLSFSTDVFLTPRNLTNVLMQISTNAIIGIGYTFLLASASVDLSVGNMMCLIGISAGLMSTANFPFPIILILCLLEGIIFGALNSSISVRFKLPPFLVTLAMQQIYKGVMLTLSNGSPIPNINSGIVYMGQGYVFKIPVPVILMFALVIIGAVILTMTKFGRNVIAVGGNQEAARVSGIDVNKTRIGVSILLGLTTALTALVSCGRVGSATTTLGGDTVMDVIAAVVIGGTPMGGGSGSVIGTIFGCLTIGLISNGLNLLKVSSYLQVIAKGLIILFAVIMDNYTESIYEKMRNK